MQAYLSKYTTKPKKPKSRKKSSNVVLDDGSIQESIDEADVNSKFKGFKRVGSETSPSTETNETDKKTPETEPSKPPNPPPEQQTVYRDLTGKVVDISQLKSSSGSTKTENIVLSSANFPQSTPAPLSFTAGKDDKDYNEALKAQTSVEDPMRDKVTSHDRLVYNKGMNVPNRFGIKAGVLWDGIDRSNGFEKLVMKKRNETNYQNKVIEDYDLDDE